MALEKEKEEELKNYFETKLKEQYRRGLETGVRATCGVILEKLGNGSKSFMDRITDIKKFCKTPFGLNEDNNKKKPENEVNEGSENNDVSENSENNCKENDSSQVEANQTSDDTN